MSALSGYGTFRSLPFFYKCRFYINFIPNGQKKYYFLLHTLRVDVESLKIENIENIFLQEIFRLRVTGGWLEWKKRNFRRKMNFKNVLQKKKFSGKKIGKSLFSQFRLQKKISKKIAFFPPQKFGCNTNFKKRSFFSVAIGENMKPSLLLRNWRKVEQTKSF
jgi:hypothetical protein